MFWDLRMPQFSRSTSRSSQEAVTPARWQRDAWRVGAPLPRQGLAAEAGEAGWHHDELFEQLRARVEFLNSRIEAARATLSEARPDLFDGVLDALHGLKAGIASVRVAWQADEPSLLSQLTAAPATAAVIGDALPAEPDPWDPETAEALTRVYEIAAFQERRRQRSIRPQTAQATAKPDLGQVTAGATLETRLAGLADRLQQALPCLDPSQWLGPLDARLRQFEQQIAAALPRGAAAADVPAPGALESAIGALADRIENTRTELVRLDAIEAQLGEVLAELKDTTAAARAPALPARQDMSPTPDQLASLITSYAVARRQDARIAVEVLRSIHHAVAQIVARLEEAPMGDDLRFPAGGLGEADPDADRDLLRKAYRDGERALGETALEGAWEPVHATDPHRGRGGYASSGWRWHGND
jgi:hypothetical protein